MHNPHSYPLHRDCRQRLIFTYFRDGPSEKLRGGVGEKPKKNSCKGKCKEKKLCKEEGKEKTSCRKEGPIVTFSESLSFRNQQHYQAQYE